MDFISHITASQFNRWINHRLHISYLVHFNLHAPQLSDSNAMYSVHNEKFAVTYLGLRKNENAMEKILRIVKV